MADVSVGVSLAMTVLFLRDLPRRGVVDLQDRLPAEELGDLFDQRENAIHPKSGEADAAPIHRPGAACPLRARQHARRRHLRADRQSRRARWAMPSGSPSLVALVAALLTALSYASLGSRYPRAAGAAYVTERAFGLPLLSFVVGLALVCSGLTSVATQSRVFAANLAVPLRSESIPLWWLALGFLLVLAGIVFRGIRESMWVNVLCTLVEASGLILVIAVGISYWGSVDYLEMPPASGEQSEGLILVQGAVLTFFAFIGFEDTLQRRRGMPRSEAHHPARADPRHEHGGDPLHRRRGHRGLGGAVARACRSAWPDHRGGAPRGAAHPAHRVHRHHAVRRGQHRARQLRHGLAPDLRHGASGPAAAPLRRRSRRAAHAPHRHRSRCSWSPRRSRCSAPSPSLPRRPCSCFCWSSPW